MRGGKRVGAGRKKGYSAIEAEKAREFIAYKVGQSLEPIVNALVKHAENGNIQAAKELFDRAYGRSQQPKQILESEGVKLLLDI